MDFAVEDGDRFIVPPRPATVNVFGAVFNQNSLLYQSGHRIADYLNQAGGPTRSADSGRMFVIRANGSVVPKRGFNPFAKAFESATLNPGDSVVVPQAIFRGRFMRGLLDWTQIFGQLALGAAAINILR
jgi:protein involved in polysaccharide export with SLBB domain